MFVNCSWVVTRWQ